MVIILDGMAKDKFSVGDRVIIDMCPTAMNALIWNGQIGTIEEARSFYKNNWWVKLDMGDRPNFKEKSLMQHKNANEGFKMKFRKGDKVKVVVGGLEGRMGTFFDIVPTDCCRVQLDGSETLQGFFEHELELDEARKEAE